MRFLAAVLAVGWLILLASATQVPSVSGHPWATHSLSPAHPCYSPPTSSPPNPLPTTAQAIKMNEILPYAASTWHCGTIAPLLNIWIEFYNQSSTAMNLYSSNNYLLLNDSPLPYRFPFGSAIPARGFFVLFIFASNPMPSAPFHINQISFYIGNTLADQVTIPDLTLNQLPDNAYARTIDGSGSWQITDAPTIGASNTPIQPTPTPTHPPAKSKKLTHPPKSRGGHTNKGSSTPPGFRITNQGAVAGKAQAPWSQVHLPSNNSLPVQSGAMPSPTSSPDTTTSSEAENLPRNLLLSLLLLSLGGTLYWWIKRFTSPP